MQRKHGRGWRQRTGIGCLAVVLLAACGPSRSEITDARIRTFIGGVVADEPRAALAGLRVLELGGTAGDAAAATFFALTATYPIAAGLGGGGVCLVFDGLTRTAETINFLPRDPEQGGVVAVPGSVRGISAIHARFGRLRWSQVVQPGEELARFGNPVSRALARSVESYVATTGNTNLGRMTPGGNRVAEGNRIEQPELASLLALIRAKGAGDFYAGESAKMYIDATAVLGGRVTLDDLRRFIPEWTKASRADLGVLAFHSVAGSPSGGALATMLWTMVTDQARYVQSNAEQRAHLLAEATSRALAERASNAEATAFRATTLMATYDASRRIGPNEPAAIDLSPWASAGSDGTTTFSVVDRLGSAIACGLTMNAPFGTGRVAAALGSFPAPARPIGPAGWLRSGSDFIAPIAVSNYQTGELVLIAAGSGGGPAAAVAVVNTALRSIVDARPLAEAVSAPRLVATSRPDRIFVESGFDAPARAALEARGHRVEQGSQFGQVSAILCFGGLKLDPLGCQFVTDRRGFGLAVGGTDR